MTDTEEKYQKLLEDMNAEKTELEQKLQMARIHCEELEATNGHLIAATWRERELKKKLTDTIGELNRTKVVVETQNKRITESINYSRRIQQAINPSEPDLKGSLPDSFILYLPKDLISGDFPWMLKKDGYLYVAAADCTGHGVPGAMMSMIGNLLLNDITNDRSELLPSEILYRLHHAVVQTLKQNVENSNSNDGMDIGLARIDLDNRSLLYSGAHRPMFLYRSGQVEIMSGDKFPIGGMHYKGLNAFTDAPLELQPGDTVFLFTDGYPDQIGGGEGKKLMSRAMKTFIEENYTGSMDEMKEKLHQLHLDWKGEYKQVDDILIIGIKF
jgi:serine phosphatase RsbU (regulator of sigma subunit)